MLPTTSGTTWEQIGMTRWGSYISGREEVAVLKAEGLADHPGIVLDVGCEGGRWSKLLLDRGWDPICIDVDPEAIEICARRMPAATCLCLEKGYERLPCSDAFVDLVLCLEVPDVIHSDWFLPECRRILRANGRIVTVIWNRASIRGRLASRYARRRESYDYYQKRYDAWMSEAADAGFVPEWEEGLCWMPFSRASDSVLVPLAVRLEKALGLRRWIARAPWVICVLGRIDP